MFYAFLFFNVYPIFSKFFLNPWNVYKVDQSKPYNYEIFKSSTLLHVELITMDLIPNFFASSRIFFELVKSRPNFPLYCRGIFIANSNNTEG